MAKLYTASVRDIKKMKQKLEDEDLMDTTKLVCIMRNPWGFIKQLDDVVQLKHLGPPMWLHRMSQKLIKQDGFKDSDLETMHQAFYSVSYIEYLENGELQSCSELDTPEGNPYQSYKWIMNMLQEQEKNVIIMCVCSPGNFCHRLLLYNWLLYARHGDALGAEYAGGEFELNKNKLEKLENVGPIQKTLS